VTAETYSLDVIVSPPFMENTYILRRPDRTDCVIVDPGFQPQRIIQHIEAAGLTPTHILLTHGHVDHIAGNQALKERWPQIPLLIGRGDAHMLTDAVANLSGLSGLAITSPPADRLLEEGETVDAAGFTFEVREIPGHSPGHIVYVLHSESPVIVLGGDVLFQGSIGRCDFPGGNQSLLVAGIRNKLFTPGDEAVVYPGHGPHTTVGAERKSNPFCGEKAGLYGLS